MARVKTAKIRKASHQKPGNSQALLGRVEAIRQSISKASGKWDAVAALRAIRYAR